MKTYANDTPNYTKTHLILKTTLHVRCSLPGKTRWSRDARDHRYIYYVAVASFLFFSKSLPLSRGKYVFELITVIKVIFFTEIQNCKNNWKLLTLLRVIYIKGHNLLSYFLFGKKSEKCFILLPAFYLKLCGSYRSEFWHLRRKLAVIFSKWLFFQIFLVISWVTLSGKMQVKE